MTTINAGGSATIALAIGEYLVLDGIGTSQVISVMPPNIDTSLRRFSIGATVGPYLVAASVLVVADTLAPVQYDVDFQGEVEGVSATSGSAVVAKLARKKAFCWSSHTGAVAASGLGTSQTWQMQVGIPAAAYRLRVIYQNTKTSTVVIDKTTVKCSSTYVLGGNATGAGTIGNVLFSGAASVTLPAAASAAEPTYVASDWLSVAPTERTDVTAAPYLWHVRSWIQTSVGYGYLSNLGYGAYPSNSSSGLVRAGGFAAGDLTAHTGTITNPDLQLPLAIEFDTNIYCTKVLCVGDSIMGGSQGVAGGGFYSPSEYACRAASSSAVTFSLANGGYDSQFLPQYCARVPTLLALHAPSVVVLATWSPNAPPANTAELNANISIVLAAIADIVAAKAVPVLLTGTPHNTMTVGADTIRRDSNAFFVAYAASNGMPLADVAKAVGNAAALGTVEQWESGYSSDGLHATALESIQAMGAEISAALTAAL